MHKVNYSELKNECFMKQTDKDRFSLRLRIAGGNVDIEDLHNIYQIANKYGNGHIHLTSRQCIEIPYIKLEDIEEVKVELKKSGLRQGVCGARIRTITACQGSKVCQSGLIDTSSLAKEFDDLYYGNDVPHKFKIGITGCRNNCLKAEENDFGIKGAMEPSWDKENCSFCGLCEKKCPSNCISVDKDKKVLKHDRSKCISCGRCVKVCPTKAWEGKSGYIVYIGGLFGNSIQIGRQLTPIVFSKEELHQFVNIVIDFFKENGRKGERLGHCLNRVGWNLLESKLENF